MDDGVQAVIGKSFVGNARKRGDSEFQKVGKVFPDDVEGKEEHEEKNSEKYRDSRIFPRENFIYFHRAGVTFAFVAFDDGICHHVFDKRITHVGKRGVSVKPRFVFHLHDAVFDKFALVLVESELIRHIVAALDEFCRTEPRRNAEFFCVVLDEVDYCVHAAVYGRIFRTEIVFLRFNPVFRRVDCLVDKFGNAFAFRRAYRNNGYAERVAHFLNVYASAVFAHFVHHVEGENGGNFKFEKLKREIEVALYIGCVDDVYYSVGFFVYYEIARDDFFLSVRAERVNPRKVDHGIVFVTLYLARFSVYRNARKVSDVLIRTRQCVEEGGFSAVLIACKSEYHLFNSP